MKRSILCLAGLLLLVSGFGQESQITGVRNIILMIGDGMGVAQVYAAYTANRGHLNIERAPYIGFSITYSADHYITDSGAGGTAISTGRKTKNYAIGVDSTEMPLKTILESAEEKGFSTGIVVTCAITHATPASFVAHDISREENINIVHDILSSGIDIFIGGGRQFFENPAENLFYSDSLRNKGYDVVYRLEDINTETKNEVACLVAEDYLPKISEGRGNYLSDACNIALTKLNKNENGFFMMVEGSQIDWAGHSNDMQYLINEVIDFDKAIGEAFRFADEHPGTLVIVTADHETGGLSITNGDIKTGTVEGMFATTDHSGVMVPVFAYGTGAEAFTGMYQNTELYFKMIKLLSLK